MAPMFQGKAVNRGALFWEHEGSRAMRDRKWKISAIYPKGRWELYDIEADRTEQNDLAGRYPDRVKHMAQQWEAWAKENHAIPWIWSPPFSGTQPGN